MLAISTAWLARSERPLEEMLALLAGQGFRELELNFVVHPLDIERMQRLCGRLGLHVVSLHNICSALTEPVAPDDQYGDNLASLSEEERRQSVMHLRSTAEAALRLGARAVVVHSGSVASLKGENAYFEMLRAFAAGAADAGHVRAEMRRRMAARQTLGRPHVEQLLRSLSEVCADFPQLQFGLECRYHYYSLPSLDELGYVLDRLGLPNVGYWHDCGHAQVQENLGLCRHVDWLERYGDYLIGFHLHGLGDPVHDHYAPAPGNMPFEMIRDYMREDTLRVLELNPGNSLESVLAGRDYLQALFAGQPAPQMEQAIP